MKPTTFFRTALTLTLIFSASTICTAELVIQITGTAGSGMTNWNFSGSTTITEFPIIGPPPSSGSDTRGFQIDDNDNDVHGGWDVGPNFYTGSNPNIDFSASNAVMSVNGTDLYDVLGVGKVPDVSNQFGFAIDNNQLLSRYKFEDGDVFSFTGAGTANVDISEFQAGITTADQWAFDFIQDGDFDGQFDVRFVVGNQVVPEPGSFLLGAAGIGLCSLFGRRRRP